MAVTFTLTSTGLTTVDFTDATFDFIFADVDYVPVVASPTGDGSIPPYVTETLPVILRGTSHDDMATSMQELAALQKRAAEYWVDQQQATPVWLNCKLYSETGARRALVKAIHYEFRPDVEAVYRDCAGVQDYLVGTVLIERHPYWERTVARVFPNNTPTAAAAVAYDYTADETEKMSNAGFETAGGGDPDFWLNWMENAGAGTLADEGVIVFAGSHACKMTSGNPADTCVYQDITVVPGGIYYLDFHARGDGTNAGRYFVRDNTHAANILPMTSTGVTAAAYAEVALLFTVPAGCTSVGIYLYCTPVNGGVCYFDNVFSWLPAHDIVGDVAARVNALAIQSGTAGATLTKYWMGIRSATLHGATGVTSFIPVWECEDGTNIGDASVSDDGGGSEPNTASPGGGSGDYVIINPGAGGTAIDWSDGDFHQVYGQTLTGAGYNDNTKVDAAGRFLLLLRTKMQTAGNEWRVRIRSGFGGYLQSYHDPISVASTSWNYYQVGTITMPGRNKQALETAFLSSAGEYDSIFLEAKQITGSGDLYLDCVCFVPIDEGFLKIIDTITDTSRLAVIAEGPKGDTQVLQVDDVGGGAFAIYRNEAFEFEHFRLPPGDGRIVCVYARSASSVFTDQAEFADASIMTSAYTERWAGLRGAE